MGLKIKYKKGQITIFIIIAILIVAAIIAAFLFFGGVFEGIGKKPSSEQFIDKCVRDAVKPSVDAVLRGGGRIEPSFYKLYGGQKHNYLCYQKNYYLTCVNHYPQLKEIAEDEILRDSGERVRICFDSLKQDLEDRGYSYSDGAMDYDIELAPKKVLIKLSQKIDISQGGESQALNNFDTQITSPLYDLIMVAREIVNQESQFCNFEYNGFMLFYPQFDIKRIDYDDNKIYKLFERQSGKEFKFAVRSCVLPAGA